MIPSTCPSEALNLLQTLPPDSSSRALSFSLPVSASPPPQEAPSVHIRDPPYLMRPFHQVTRRDVPSILSIPHLPPSPAPHSTPGFPPMMRTLSAPASIGPCPAGEFTGEARSHAGTARLQQETQSETFAATSSRFNMRTHVMYNPQDVNRDSKIAQYACKRKLVNEDDLVSEELNKKCRITVSPGELRLEHDWEHCAELIESGLVTFVRNIRNPLNFQFFFPDLRKSGLSLPTTFSIQIPRFYPHQPPIIFCDRSFSAQCPFVDSNGQIKNPFFQEEWNSISTLKDVVIAVRRRDPKQLWPGK
mmetsp:Transcript_7423/g.9248  ORF Transcript_7423/g.9248 Transcript_7423/m.9248 type:complete len:304 (-) Transcript_7423:150-1061(-)